MKNFKIILVITVMLMFMTTGYSFSSSPIFEVTIQNLQFTSPNALEFDIYVQNTNAKESQLNYILGQYFLDFNPKIANGGELTYSIVGTDLPPALVPRNPTVSGNQLMLATNAIPPKDNLPVISGKAPGTLIVKMRLQTSAKKFLNHSVDLKFRMGPENPSTKVLTYENNKISEVFTKDGPVTADNSTIENEVTNVIPKEYALLQNYPNPFNPTTSITFDIPVLADVKLSIYDITGRELSVLVNKQLEPGSYSFNWNAAQYASGIYFYRIKSGSFVQTKKMALLK